MALTLPLRVICGSVFLFVTLPGSHSVPLQLTYDMMKGFWREHNCVFPPPQMYTDLFNSKAVLRSCENLDHSSASFISVLCSTFFSVSKSICSQNNTSVMEILKAEVLGQVVEDPTWDVCISAASLGELYRDVFGFIARDPAECKHFCVDNRQSAPVCRWLVAAAQKYSDAATATDSTKKAGEAAEENKIPKDATKGGGASASGNTTSHTGAGVRTDTESQEDANTERKVPVSGSEGSESSIPVGAGGDAATQPKNPQLTPQNSPNATNLGAQQLSTNTTGVAQPVSLPRKPIPDPGNAGDSVSQEHGGNAGNYPGTKGVVGTSSSNGESQVNKTTLEVTSNLRTGSQSLTNNISKAAIPSTNGNASQQSGVAATTKPEGNPPATNISNVTNPPASVNTTQQPRVPETPVPKGNPPPDLAHVENSQLPDSTTASTPTTSKVVQQQVGVDPDTEKQQDQENTNGGADNNQANQVPTSQDDHQIPTSQDGHQIPTSQDNHPIPTSQDDHQIPLPQDGEIPPGRTEEEEKLPSSFQAGMPSDEVQRVYHTSDDDLGEDEPPSGHFMAYFVTAVVLCVAGYVIYHNKQKIFAFVLEGRRDAQQRRRASGGNGSGSSSAKYHKLKPSVEEVMPSLEKSTTSTNYIY